jgi:hypothetical protein
MRRAMKDDWSIEVSVRCEQLGGFYREDFNSDGAVSS